MHPCLRQYLYLCLRQCLHPCLRPILHQCLRPSLHQCLRPSLHQCLRPSLHQCLRQCLHLCLRQCLYPCLRQCLHLCLRPSLHLCLRPRLHQCLRPRLHLCLRSTRRSSWEATSHRWRCCWSAVCCLETQTRPAVLCRRGHYCNAGKEVPCPLGTYGNIRRGRSTGRGARFGRGGGQQRGTGPLRVHVAQEYVPAPVPALQQLQVPAPHFLGQCKAGHQSSHPAV
ncbi:hypothetical protein B484DRAFT_341310 [Ochromonadaceae sp. CCMP2298]|nr:hypothetical protein B484DRAFT_341310 [Ochromonadaceae sp. CCMP2298]